LIIVKYNNTDSTIYDLELYKPTYLREHKLIQKYCEVTKLHLKYYNSIYSSSVYYNKPLLRLPITNIDKIMISKTIDLKLKSGPHMSIFIHIHIKYDESKIH
jgi:hypothetical protein